MPRDVTVSWVTLASSGQALSKAGGGEESKSDSSVMRGAV
jgi:hypothetical protein